MYVVVAGVSMGFVWYSRDLMEVVGCESVACGDGRGEERVAGGAAPSNPRRAEPGASAPLHQGCRCAGGFSVGCGREARPYPRLATFGPAAHRTWVASGDWKAFKGGRFAAIFAGVGPLSGGLLAIPRRALAGHTLGG